MEDLTIEIHGPRSEGKSTLAVFIRELINNSNTRYFVPNNVRDTEGMKGRYGQVVKELNERPIHPKRIRVAVCPECSSVGLCGVHEDAS